MVEKMPTLDFLCKTCNTVEELTISYEDRNGQICSSCGMTLEVQLATPSVHSFPSGVYEHIGEEPVYIGSRAKLKEECKKNDCFAPGILDGDHYGREV